MRFDVLTLHPDQVRGPLTTSVLGRAAEKGLIEVGIHDIRDHGLGRHRSVDDTPYGGGAGMVMRIDVVAEAVREVAPEGSSARVIHMSPLGRPFDQQTAARLAQEPHLVLICGHYEGIDARVDHLVHETISLGDFVLTGGEIAACAVVDAVARLRPGVLGNDDSAADESFSQGLLEYPQFTRPRSWEGHDVPEILLSGHHGRIAAWRLEQAKGITEMVRPDLYERWVAANPPPPEPSRRRRKRRRTADHGDVDPGEGPA